MGICGNHALDVALIANHIASLDVLWAEHLVTMLAFQFWGALAAALVTSPAVLFHVFGGCIGVKAALWPRIIQVAIKFIFGEDGDVGEHVGTI